MAAGTPLYSALKLHGQTKTADREVTGKEEGLLYLLTTYGVNLDMSLRRSVSAPQMLNCWLWVPVEVVYRESSTVLPADAVCDIVATLQINTFLSAALKLSTCLSAALYVIF